MASRICGKVNLGEAALKHVREVNPDFVLRDVVLTGDMTGIEAAAVITFQLPHSRHRYYRKYRKLYHAPGKRNRAIRFYCETLYRESCGLVLRWSANRPIL